MPRHVDLHRPRDQLPRRRRDVSFETTRPSSARWTTPNDGAFSFDLPYGTNIGVYGVHVACTDGTCVDATRPLAVLYTWYPTGVPSPVPSSVPTPPSPAPSFRCRRHRHPCRRPRPSARLLRRRRHRRRRRRARPHWRRRSRRSPSTSRGRRGGIAPLHGSPTPRRPPLAPTCCPTATPSSCRTASRWPRTTSRSC